MCWESVQFEKVKSFKLGFAPMAQLSKKGMFEIMKVIHKNEGAYVDYSLEEGILSFRGGELTLNLPELQRDYPVSLDISEDFSGKLAVGASHRYVAELYIPARQSAVEKTGIADDFGFPVLRRVYTPFSADDVVLTLWSIKGE